MTPQGSAPPSVCTTVALAVAWTVILPSPKTCAKKLEAGRVAVMVIESPATNCVEDWYEMVSPLAFLAYSPAAALPAALQLTGRYAAPARAPASAALWRLRFCWYQEPTSIARAHMP